MRIFILTALSFFVFVFVVFAQSQKTNKPHIEAGLECESCHGVKAPDKRASQTACIECHTNKADSSAIDLKDASGNSYKVSPHASHAGQIRCTICHKIHAPSALYCNEGCHHKFVITVP